MKRAWNLFKLIADSSAEAEQHRQDDVSQRSAAHAYTTQARISLLGSKQLRNISKDREVRNTYLNIWFAISSKYR